MTSPQTAPSAQLLSDTWYNRVVQGATLILPAIGALYVALALVWGLPYMEQIGGTIAAANVFLGVLAAVAKRLYNASGAGFDGTVVIEETEDGMTAAFKEDAQVALATKDVVRFTIKR